MSEQQQMVYTYLDAMEIAYRVIEHPAVYTIGEMESLPLENKEGVVKNLLLRDDKKQRFFLVAATKDKSVDTKALRRILGCRPLTFAAEEYLESLLGLEKGAVSPLGVLNDQEHRVEVLLDQELMELPLVGVHPNDNTATVLMAPADLVRVIRQHGNSLTLLEIPAR